MNDPKQNAIDEAEESGQRDRELSLLFDEETVEMAGLIDAADININDQIVRSITEGINKLKKLAGDREGQRDLLEKLEPGERLMLCLWIRDMDLLKKITNP